MTTMIADQNRIKGKEAEGDLIVNFTTGDYFTPGVENPDGTFTPASTDTNGFVTNPANTEALNRLSENELGHDYDPSDPEDVAWAEDRVAGITVSDTTRTLQEFDVGMETYFSSPSFTGLDTAVQQEVRETIDGLRWKVAMGFSIDIDDSGNITLLGKDGVTSLGDSSVEVPLDNDNTVKTNEDGSVTINTPTGETATFTQDDDDNWTTEDRIFTPVKDTLAKTLRLEDLLGYKGDEDIAKSSGKGDHGFYQKDEDGNWFRVKKNGAGEWEKTGSNVASYETMTGGKKITPQGSEGGDPNADTNEAPKGVGQGDYYLDKDTLKINDGDGLQSEIAPEDLESEDVIELYKDFEKTGKEIPDSLIKTFSESFEDYLTIDFDSDDKRTYEQRLTDLNELDPRLFDAVIANKTPESATTTGSGDTHKQAKRLDNPKGSVVYLPEKGLGSPNTKDTMMIIGDRRQNATTGNDEGVYVTAMITSGKRKGQMVTFRTLPGVGQVKYYPESSDFTIGARKEFHNIGI